MLKRIAGIWFGLAFLAAGILIWNGGISVQDLVSAGTVNVRQDEGKAAVALLARALHDWGPHLTGALLGGVGVTLLVLSVRPRASRRPPSQLQS